MTLLSVITISSFFRQILTSRNYDSTIFLAPVKLLCKGTCVVARGSSIFPVFISGVGGFNDDSVWKILRIVETLTTKLQTVAGFRRETSRHYRFLRDILRPHEKIQYAGTVL
jgi:hypothetical protein